MAVAPRGGEREGDPPGRAQCQGSACLVPTPAGTGAPACGAARSAGDAGTAAWRTARAKAEQSASSAAKKRPACETESLG